MGKRGEKGGKKSKETRTVVSAHLIPSQKGGKGERKEKRGERVKGTGMATFLHRIFLVF